jgi:hypothetical protein
MQLYTYYLLGMLTTSTVMFLWFSTDLKLHVFQILAKVGLFNMPDDVFSTDDLDTVLLIRHPLTGELLSCPGCFSVHVSFWVAICMSLLAGIFRVDSIPFLVACTTTWPVLANLITTKLIK